MSDMDIIKSTQIIEATQSSIIKIDCAQLGMLYLIGGYSSAHWYRVPLRECHNYVSNILQRGLAKLLDNSVIAEYNSYN